MPTKKNRRLTTNERSKITLKRNINRPKIGGTISDDVDILTVILSSQHRTNPCLYLLKDIKRFNKADHRNNCSNEDDFDDEEYHRKTMSDYIADMARAQKDVESIIAYSACEHNEAQRAVADAIDSQREKQRQSEENHVINIHCVRKQKAVDVGV